MMAGASAFEDGVAGHMFLTWSGRSTAFALDAASVLRVVERREWGGAEPYDLSRVLDVDDTIEPARILEVKNRTSRIGLLAFGAMRLCIVTAEHLLDVPELVRARGTGRLFRRLAVVDGSPALWVLDVDAIHRDASVRRPTSEGGVIERVERCEGNR